MKTNERKALKIISKASQDLIWFDSIETPIRELFDKEELKTVLDSWKERGIIRYWTGYNDYPDSAVLSPGVRQVQTKIDFKINENSYFD